MRKKLLFSFALTCGIIVLASCGGNNTPTQTTTSTVAPTTTTTVEPTTTTSGVTSTSTTTTQPTTTTTTTPIVEEMSYVEKNVNIYREKDVVDKTIKLRFYEETPNVPYIGVKEYYKEFFKNNLTMVKHNNSYQYTTENDGFLKFDSIDDIITLYDTSQFSHHPDFKQSNSQTFMSVVDGKTTPLHEKSIALSPYHIDIHGDEEAYVPMSLLSSFSGGLNGYYISYNGKSIYVLDTRGQLVDTNTDYAYFKTSEEYMSTFLDFETERAEDMIIYNYGQLCFNFDNLRGYTSQMVFGDNNLLTIGLDGILENYYPEIKELLLSKDKKEYYTGYYLTLSGLYDGGHTGAFNAGDKYIVDSINAVKEADKITQSMRDLMTKVYNRDRNKMITTTYVTLAKKAAFPEYVSATEAASNPDKELNAYLYNFDNNTKTAFISFDSFEVNYEGWDNYYKNGKKESDIPTTGDSYAFIRKSLYQAVDDQARNVVIDLTTNGGGDSLALSGIVCLLNKAKCDYVVNDTLNMNRSTTTFFADINLDGEWNDEDIAECNKFNFSIAILTSAKAFSCGNLLPSILKEIGYAIIGQRSGGGSCAISIETTADGLPYVRSSNHCLSNTAGENIDVGVPLDLEIEIGGTAETPDYSKFFDFTTINDCFVSLGLAPEEL